MYPEAKSVLDIALTEGRSAAEDASAIVLRAVAEIMMNRPENALKDLSDPSVGELHRHRTLPYRRGAAFG